jgi:bacteriocin biosynthesis cyclodehydratase domain-containing protein
MTTHFELVGNPRWHLFLEGEQLFLSGGADEIYLVDEVPTLAAAQRLLVAAQSNHYASIANDHELGAALRQLRRIGAIATQSDRGSPLPVALIWSGDALPLLEAALAQQTLAQQTLAQQARSGDNAIIFTHENQAAQLAIVIRTNASWRDTIATYERAALCTPHLLVDLAYHHTLSIGPYVVPGDTACIACIGHRIAHQWGDALVPTQPAVALQHEVVAGLLLNIVNDFAAHGMCTDYVEHAISLNLRTLSSRRERVFRLPWCSVCSATTVAQSSQPDGRLPLPWV